MLMSRKVNNTNKKIKIYVAVTTTQILLQTYKPSAHIRIYDVKKATISY